MKKQLSRCHNDKCDIESNIAIEHMNSTGPTECKYTQWFRRISGKVILVILLMGVFIVAQGFRLPAKWQMNCLYGYDSAPNLDITKAAKGIQLLGNHHVPFFPQAPAPGISIAVSKDPDTNIQLYDLDSSGVLRIRRRTNSSDQTNTKWTSPQVIPADPKPKKASPLAAIAFQFQAGVTELRVYYLDESNRIVEFGASFSSSSDPSWSRTQFFSTGSTGGLAALWLGSDGIRLYFIDKNESVNELMWHNNNWRSPTSLNLPASAKSPMAVQAYYLNPGQLYGIFLHYVTTDNKLAESHYIPQHDPNKFQLDRIIDPDITKTGGGLTSAIAIDDNVRFWRAYYLGKDNGLTARNAGPPGVTQYDQNWSRVPLSPDTDILGGAVAAVTWKENIRVFYVSKGSLVEVALLFTPSNTEGAWSSLGSIA